MNIFYIIAAADRCKLGITNDVTTRLKAHRTMAPEAELLLEIKYDTRREARLAERKALDLVRSMPGARCRQEVVQGVPRAILVRAIAEELEGKMGPG